MEKILDLHIHSKYSRACSKELELPKIARACEIKGIDICVTGDFTHPAWFKHIKENLIEDSGGVYKLRDNSSKTRFIIGTEIASIKKHNGQTRRLHLLVFAPNIEVAEKFNKKINDRGINLKADGRPILGMTAKDILELMLEIDSRMVMIPAHAWTPWFGVFGSKGGYDSLDDCFEDLTAHIFAIETGLSSDPAMNWRIGDLDNKSIVSFSDAHSLPKMAREATVFEAPINYDGILKALRSIQVADQSSSKPKIAFTIEFFPEEGKYHFSGHRNCGIKQSDEETANRGTICPVCKKKLTLGVIHRVNSLAKRETKELGTEIDKEGFVKSKFLLARPPFVNLVPLQEIIAESLHVSSLSEKVRQEYLNLVKHFGSELNVLLKAEISEIVKVAGVANIAQGVQKVRERDLVIEPGFDGVYGVVKIWPGGLQKPKIETQADGQIRLFD